MADVKPIEKLTAVEWRCPFCWRGNGVPEIKTCACGAVREGDSVVRDDVAAPAVKPAAVQFSTASVE